MNPGTIRPEIESLLCQEALPAATVMGMALYHPQWGYYRRATGPWGLAGKDYYTALDCGPLLGQTLALRLESAWRSMGQPPVFTVLEPGAGRGWLGRDLLRFSHGDFAKALRYIHMDDNPAGREAAREALQPFQEQVRFASEHERIEPFQGAILSNELFDASPAQPWRWNGKEWEREVLTANGPGWEAADPGAAGDWFAQHAEGGLEPGDGSVWMEGWPAILAKLSSNLQQGLFLAIDYGDSAARLLAKGADLRRYRQHQVDGNWWEDLGNCDLTADVDFTRLAQLAAQEGLEELQWTTLGRWIRQHAPLQEWEAQWQNLAGDERRQRMENLLALTLPGMMGDRFKVLEGWKQ